MTGLADRPFDRPDGKLKVTGAARYAADHPTENLLNGAFACATIAHGKIRALHTDAAKTAPGVRAVLTAETMPRFAALKDSPAGQTFMPMQDDHIEYEGQPIALLLAERLEQATYAASLVRADYEEAPAETDFRRGLDRQVKLDVWQWWAPTDSSTGDVEAALSAAPATLAATYRTSDRHHNPIEPAATIAQWQDGKLLIWDAAQGLGAVRAVLAQALGLDPRDIRVRADFIGGGFGCKGYVWPHQVLAAAAARVVGRPVKIVLTRAQDYTSHGYQPATEQTIALAAQTDGALAGVRHHVVMPTALSDDYVEFAAIGTRSLYASPAIETRHRAVRVARSRPTPMRAPHEGPGLVALEIAMDELAAQLRIDPVELRLRNYSDEDAGKPFSSKKLRECYTQGARLFGWSGRDPRPGSMRQGRELVGYGMATAAMTTFRSLHAGNWHGRVGRHGPRRGRDPRRACRGRAGQDRRHRPAGKPDDRRFVEHAERRIGRARRGDEVASKTASLVGHRGRGSPQRIRRIAWAPRSRAGVGRRRMGAGRAAGLRLFQLRGDIRRGAGG
jgi:xanthine dehydrogenase YagR molybdenum-binding subunit